VCMAVLRCRPGCYNAGPTTRPLRRRPGGTRRETLGLLATQRRDGGRVKATPRRPEARLHIDGEQPTAAGSLELVSAETRSASVPISGPQGAPGQAASGEAAARFEARHLWADRPALACGHQPGRPAADWPIGARTNRQPPRLLSQFGPQRGCGDKERGRRLETPAGRLAGSSPDEKVTNYYISEKESEVGICVDAMPIEQMRGPIMFSSSGGSAPSTDSARLLLLHMHGVPCSGLRESAPATR
jgi:hypothetical protein